MQKVKFFLPKDALNEATEYYCNLIEQSFDRNKFIVTRTKDRSSIEVHDIVVTIRPGDLSTLRKKCEKVVTWFQGIGPEEYLLLHGLNLRSYLIKQYLERIEKRALKKSDICLFVSERMRHHYENKYNLDLGSKSVIIPCYNKSFNKNLLENEQRYKHLTFVYAGGLFAWQCIEETLQIFKEVHRREHSAHLTLLTGDKKQAELLVDKYQIENVSISYVSLDKLSVELGKYKYAFLIRKNHIVNNVSTPTKMNSYLASGLIPIYTNVIDDFEKNLNLGDFGVKLNNNMPFSKCADRILEHHQQKIDIQNLSICFKSIFSNYYNDEKYNKILAEQIEKALL